MKKYLIIALAMVALAACSKREPIEPTPQPASGEIPLGTGVMTKAEFGTANQGGRTDISGFVMGDSIGVTSVFDASTPGTPDWASAPHFSSIPAIANAPVGEATAAKTNTFTWAASKTQFFSGNKKIYLYAYSPFASGANAGLKGVKFIDETGAEDKLEVSLLAQTITADEGGDDIKQPDVMFAYHSTAIDRVSTAAETKLTFNHLLAQLNFSIVTAFEAKEKPVIHSITFRTVKKGEFTLTGTPTFKRLPETGGTVAADSVTYVFDNHDGTEVPQQSVSGGATGTKPLTILPQPLMVLPLSAEDAQKSVMTINIEFMNYGKFDIMVDMSKMKAIEAGKLNMINLTIIKIEVGLNATVAPWGTGSVNDIPVE